MSGAGFEPTRVRQFTIFLENRVGRLMLLVRALEQNVGRIIALSIEESADSALVRLICSDSDAGRDALRGEGFSFSESDVLAVELPRTAHPLETTCHALLAAELNIHYAYPLLACPGGRPAIALYVDDPTLAAQLLIRKNFRLLVESDLKNLA
jgi:hypothetical protein